MDRDMEVRMDEEALFLQLSYISIFFFFSFICIPVLKMSLQLFISLDRKPAAATETAASTHCLSFSRTFRCAPPVNLNEGLMFSLTLMPLKEEQIFYVATNFE